MEAAPGVARRLIERLKRITALTDRVVQQTQDIQWGNRHIPDRIVSLWDPDARPVIKGRLKSPTEFGYKGRDPGD